MAVKRRALLPLEINYEVSYYFFAHIEWDDLRNSFEENKIGKRPLAPRHPPKY